MYVYVTEEPNLLRENTVYITKECLFQLLWHVHEEMYIWMDGRELDKRMKGGKKERKKERTKETRPIAISRAHTTLQA